MAIASGTNVVVGFKKETVYGEEVAGEDYQIIPFKSASLSLAKTNHESAVITGNRELQDVIMGAHSVTGEISFDLAYQPAYLDTWALGHLDTWTLGHLNTWRLENLDAWTSGHLDTWTRGHLDTWKLGHLDAWTLGHLDTWTLARKPKIR